MIADPLATRATELVDFDSPTPADVFASIRGEPGAVFLDGRSASERAPWSHLAWNPARRFRIEADGRATIDGARLPVLDPLTQLDEFLARESADRRTVFGVIAYELGRLIEPAAGGKLDSLPLAALGSYDRVLDYDHRNRAWSRPPPPRTPSKVAAYAVGGPTLSLGEEQYSQRFDRARALIGAGDIYQVNLSLRLDAEFRGHPAALYERLASGHPVPYGAYFDAGDFQVLSNSPELFLERRGAGVRTRPIKGTRRRGADPTEDGALREELRRSAKERAEHVMIVDLERSDLGRIAEVGSVRVEESETIRSYPTLHHLESTIAATLRDGTHFSDVLRATFPGGSITGAPKIRAMQTIDELEGESRGFYTGAVLHHPPSGDFTMSIAIRTATVSGGRIRYAAGGAVTWDSAAGDEYRECLLKAKPFLAALEPR